MRKIKFRAKTEQEEWIIGHYVGKSSVDEVCILPFQNVNYDIGCINDSECYYCIANTLGQFTELYDKNDKEIYEGDILEWSYDNKLYIVKFFNGVFHASGIKEGGYSLYLLANLDNYHHKIVGNIFDNPELLEEDK